MSGLQVPRYPLDKNELGNASWKLLHSYAAQYPDKPTADDKREFHMLLKSVIRTIPEGDCKCKSHAVEYVQKNPPNMNNRKELVNWLCVFHNDTNKRSAKAQIDCKALLESTAECDSCKVLPKKVVEAADVDGPLKQTLGDYKKLSVKVIEELCKREGLPVPRIIFAPCPTAQHTSCNIMIKDKDDAVIKEKEKAPIVYLNPTNFGLRVLIHEWKEYQRQMKNTGRYLPKDEETVERHTQEIIEKYFPADSYDKGAKKLIQPIVMKDEVVTSEPVAEPKPVEPMAPTAISTNSNTFGSNRKSLITGRRAFHVQSSFPSFNKFRERQHEAEEQEASSAETGGLLSYFDGLYDPIAKYMGISARSLNLANTPNIFAEGSQIAINSQFSPFGSLIATTLLGIGLFVVTALHRDGITLADRNMLAQLGGQFIWSGLRGASSPEVQATASIVGSDLAAMDFESIKPLMFNADSYLASFLTDSQQRQQANVQSRSQQRSGAGANRIGGGGLGRAGTRDTAIKIDPEMMQRLQQRASGIETAPEDVGIFRDFPSGAAPRETPTISAGYSPGTAVPRKDSGGGIGFTYVPNITRQSLSEEERDLLEQMGYANPSEEY